jgi:hypothetical protein
MVSISGRKDVSKIAHKNIADLVRHKLNAFIFILKTQYSSISSPAFDDSLVEIGGLPITVFNPSFFYPSRKIVS